MTHVNDPSKRLKPEAERRITVKTLQQKARKLKQLVDFGLTIATCGVAMVAICCWILSGTTVLPYG